MATKKTIAIIGATGKMGSAIAKSLAKGPFRLLLFANDYEKLDAVKKEISTKHKDAEVEISACPKDASWEADIIIPAVPFHAEKEIAGRIRQVATQKIVISIANPLNASFDGLVTSSGSSAAEELQKLLPDSKVIKAFNTNFSADFDHPFIAGKQVDTFIAGNDEEALQAVAQIVSSAGFNPIIAGDLPVSRTLENMSLLLIRLNLKYKYNWSAGWKVLHN